MNALREDRSRVRAAGDATAFGSSAADALERLFAEEPGQALRRMPGRATFLDKARGLVIKRFEGDEARDWWFERVRPGGPRSPGRREGETLAALRSGGFDVPEPVFWVEEESARSRAGGRSAVVMRRVPHTTDLRTLLRQEPALAHRYADRLALTVADFHRAGWYHRDLYLHHWLVGEGGRLTLIDLGRARRERAPRLRWLVKDLAALALWLPDGVDTTARERFLRAWERSSGVGPFSRRGRRRLRRAIFAKRERLGAHEPRTPDSIAEVTR